jgi:threonine/homoserine/homoserine lactone efflux protein
MFAIEPDFNMTFVLTTTALILTLCPIVTLTIVNSLTYGTRSGLKIVLGTSTANGLMPNVGGFGMASVFGLLAEWLEYLRWGEGSAYLVWLGGQQWREKAIDL